jgi:hypothetical protein
MFQKDFKDGRKPWAMIIKSKHTTAIAWTLLVTMTSPGFAQTSALHMSAARAAAPRECNVKAQPFHNEPTWGNWELYIYRACMAEHHQVE